MKVANLLLLSSMALTATGASATIVDGVRQKPVPAKSALTMAEPMYLYNVGSKQFFKGANDWSTRASVGEAGYKVWINKHLDASDSWDGTTVTLKDSVETASKILMTWAAADGNMWVDWANQADTLWTLKNQGDDIYRFAAGPNPVITNDAGETTTDNNSPENTFVGTQKADASNTRLFWNLSEADGNVDWYFVSVKDAEAYAAELAIYTAAEELKKVMDEADASIDFATERALYANEAATLEELNAAIVSAKNKIAKAQEESVDPNNPVDKTNLITNASYDSNTNDGWSGTTPGFQTYTNAEFYSKTYDTYQKITDAPSGVYGLSLHAFYRSGYADGSYTNYKNGTNQNAQLYAIAGGDTLTTKIMNPFAEALTTPKGMNESSVTADDGTVYYIPNNMETAAAYFNDGMYKNTMFFATEDGEMTIGMKKGTTISGDWTLFDNWGLTYYGKGAAAYTMWLNNLKANAKDYSSLGEDVLVTAGTVEAYKAAIDGLTASSKDDIMAAIQTIADEEAKVEANLAAWQAYKDALAEGKNVATDGKVLSSEAKSELGDYVDLEAEEITDALTMTTEEITAETEKLNKMIEEAKQTLAVGTDVSDMYLANANFEKTTGWTIKKASGGNVAYGGSSSNKCFEAWNNSDFDVYQEVTAPVGVYKISVQGFYRYGRGTTAYDAYTAGTAPNNTVNVYVNNNSSRFKSVFEEKVKYGSYSDAELYQHLSSNGPFVDSDSTYWYPNDMSNASLAFAKGLYTSSSYGVVAKSGDKLRVGVKGNTSQLGDSWAIWDNFKMVYCGTDPASVLEVLTPEVAAMKDTLATITSSESQVIGADVLADLQSAIAEAEKYLSTGAKSMKASASQDGDAMFAALTKLLAAKEAVTASREKFATLNAKVDELNAALTTGSGAAAVLTQGLTLSENLQTALSAKTLNDADVDKNVEEITVIVEKLKIPADMTADNASVTNPYDATSVLSTPGFDKDGANSVDGWTLTTGYNFGNDDTQKAALALEYYEKDFDINQTINYLPNGWYKVVVNAFDRVGSTANDYSVKDTEKTTSYLYAKSGDNYAETNIMHLGAGATEDKGYSGTSEVGTGLYVPNDMVSANAYFLDGSYVNEVEVQVVDGTLTLGMKKESHVSSSWTIMDNWKLYYLGTTGTGINGVQENDGQAVKVEFFGLDGVKKPALTSGVNIIKTTVKGGAVKVTKIVIK